MHPLSVLISALLLVSACHGPGREAGDDPTRNDESPGEGRPIDDAARRPTDAPKPNATDDSGALDGASDETTTPTR